MHTFFMYIYFQNENEKFTIIQRKSEYDYHEIAGRKWQDVWL